VTGFSSGFVLRQPDRFFTSDGLTPEVTIRTRTSPAAGLGRGASTIESTSPAAPARL
jgi:hypothetical protein